jgi:hypothetical protein
MVVEEVELYKDLYPFVDLPRIVLGGGDGGGMYGVPSRIYLTDTTLRDGQQGWRNLTFEECVRIYELLVELRWGWCYNYL